MHVEKNNEVKRKGQYVITYKGLRDGIHLFDFKVDDSFFESFENSEIEKGNADIHVTLNKKSTIMEFLFDIKGEVLVPCDRCLDLVAMEIEYQAPLYVKFGESHEETDELFIISERETEIDLSQFIFEFIHLSLPFRRVHPDDENGNSTCNKEMLKRLAELSVNEEKQDTDPRWNNLKGLFNNN